MSLSHIRFFIDHNKTRFIERIRFMQKENKRKSIVMKEINRLIKRHVAAPGCWPKNFITLTRGNV